MTASAASSGGLPVIINIARDFSRYPGGRFKDDGQFSGQEFRDEFLVPAVRTAKTQGSRVIVEIDGAAGYPASFLEEAFGGLVREGHFTARELKSLLQVRAGPVFESYRILIDRYIDEAILRTEA